MDDPVLDAFDDLLDAPGPDGAPPPPAQPRATTGSGNGSSGDHGSRRRPVLDAPPPPDRTDPVLGIDPPRFELVLLKDRQKRLAAIVDALDSNLIDEAAADWRDRAVGHLLELRLQIEEEIEAARRPALDSEDADMVAQAAQEVSDGLLTAKGMVARLDGLYAPDRVMELALQLESGNLMPEDAVVALTGAPDVDFAHLTELAQQVADGDRTPLWLSRQLADSFDRDRVERLALEVSRGIRTAQWFVQQIVKEPLSASSGGSFFGDDWPSVPPEPPRVDDDAWSRPRLRSTDGDSRRFGDDELPPLRRPGNEGRRQPRQEPSLRRRPEPNKGPGFGKRILDGLKNAVSEPPEKRE
jgi:hypothetical protein